MDHNSHGLGGVYGTLLTVVLLFISRFALADWAAAAAIFAGFTTGAWNVYRFIKDRKNSKLKKDE